MCLPLYKDEIHGHITFTASLWQLMSFFFLHIIRVWPQANHWGPESSFLLYILYISNILPVDGCYAYSSFALSVCFLWCVCALSFFSLSLSLWLSIWCADFRCAVVTPWLEEDLLPFHRLAAARDAPLRKEGKMVEVGGQQALLLFLVTQPPP